MSESTILTFKKGRAGKGGRGDSHREKKRRRVEGLHPPLSHSLREKERGRVEGLHPLSHSRFSFSFYIMLQAA